MLISRWDFTYFFLFLLIIGLLKINEIGFYAPEFYAKYGSGTVTGCATDLLKNEIS